MSKFNIFSTSIFEQLGENNIPKLSSEGKKDRWGTQKREVWQQSTILTFSKNKNELSSEGKKDRWGTQKREVWQHSTILTFSKNKNERIKNYDHLKSSLFFY